MTTTDNSLDVTGAHNIGARTSAGPILDAFDAIAASGGDPHEMAGKQFRFIMEQNSRQCASFLQGAAR